MFFVGAFFASRSMGASRPTLTLLEMAGIMSEALEQD
jgi:hypothetical protein